MDKKSFVFYVSWNEAIKKMDEKELRRFIDNLCNYAEGKPLTFDGRLDEIMWSQVQPLLDHNEKKRQKRIENGKKGGAPVGNTNAIKNNLNQANQTETSVEGRGLKDEGRGLKDEGRGLKDEGKKEDVDVEGRKLKEDVEERLTEEMKEVINKCKQFGFGKLTTKEAGLYWKIKEIYENV